MKTTTLLLSLLIIQLLYTAFYLTIRKQHSKSLSKKLINENVHCDILGVTFTWNFNQKLSMNGYQQIQTEQKQSKFISFLNSVSLINMYIWMGLNIVILLMSIFGDKIYELLGYPDQEHQIGLQLIQEIDWKILLIFILSCFFHEIFHVISMKVNKVDLQGINFSFKLGIPSISVKQKQLGTSKPQRAIAASGFIFHSLVVFLSISISWILYLVYLQQKQQGVTVATTTTNFQYYDTITNIAGNEIADKVDYEQNVKYLSNKLHSLPYIIDNQYQINTTITDNNYQINFGAVSLPMQSFEIATPQSANGYLLTQRYVNQNEVNVLQPIYIENFADQLQQLNETQFCTNSNQQQLCIMPVIDNQIKMFLPIEQNGEQKIIVTDFDELQEISKGMKDGAVEKEKALGLTYGVKILIVIASINAGLLISNMIPIKQSDYTKAISNKKQSLLIYAYESIIWTLLILLVVKLILSYFLN